MSVVAAIPVRLQSTRLPNKPLLSETGMPLVVYTARNAARASLVDHVVVVTDSRDVYCCCRHYEVDVMLQEHDAWCGTQRIAEVARCGALKRDLIINVQCDEPLIEPETLVELVRLLQRSEPAVIGTVVAPLESVSDFANEDVVKADLDYGDRVGWFCRSGWFARPYHHVGVYGFHRQALLDVGALPQSDTSRRWSLEQLTWLDAGYEMRAVHAERAPISVNSAEDYHRFCEAVSAKEKFAVAS